ncbi:MAG: hypothetical protein LUD47_01085 [Clostridia bacterium]|nr:hypothetical protein [Clostridia bacterium]
MEKKRLFRTLCVAMGIAMVASVSVSLMACDALFSDGSSDSDGTVSGSGTSYSVDVYGESSSGSVYVTGESEDGSVNVNVEVDVDISGAFDIFHNHVYTATPMEGSEPTCESAGYGIYSCSCGAQYSGIIPATGHDLYITGDGLYRCANCGVTWSLVNGDGHYYSQEAIYVSGRWITLCTDETCKTVKELEPGELSSYTRLITSAEAFGEPEEAGKTTYGQDAEDAYRVLGSGKYVLRSDIGASLKIEKGADVEIDLNGYSLAPDGAAHTVFVLPMANLTVCDSSVSGAGRVLAGENGSAIYNKEGIVELSSGTFARVGEDVIVGGGDPEPASVDAEERAFAVIENKGDMKIGSDVTVSATYAIYDTFEWEEYVLDANGNRIPKTDSNGTVMKTDDGEIVYETETHTGTLEETGLLSDRPLIVNGYLDDAERDEYVGRNVGASLKMDGGTYTGGKYIENEIFGSMEISGYAGVACAEGCIRTYGNLDVSGGNYSAASGDVIEICNDGESVAAAKNFCPTINISGGSFADAVQKTDYTFAVTSETSVSAGAEIYISGGVFKGSFSLGKTTGGDGYVFAKLEISGGEFVSWPGDEFLAEGYAVEKDADSYVVGRVAESHNHVYVATWTWEEQTEAKDGKEVVVGISGCTVTLTCQTEFCAEKTVVLEDGNVTSEEIAATCTSNKLTVYTASVAYGGTEYTDTYTVEEEGTVLEHTHESDASVDWSWETELGDESNDYVSTIYATCTFMCDVCGKTYTVREAVTMSEEYGYIYVAEFEDEAGNIYWCTSEYGDGETAHGKGTYEDYLSGQNNGKGEDAN